MDTQLGGGFKHCVFKNPQFGEMIQFDEHIFQLGGRSHQPFSHPGFSQISADQLPWLTRQMWPGCGGHSSDL